MTSDSLGRGGWCKAFATAKDRWVVAEDGVRSFFWHTETGCCFEWDQEAATLFQYSEESKAELPSRLPVWSVEFPKNAWIWETLPLPPTDMSAQITPQAGEGVEAQQDSPSGVERSNSSQSVESSPSDRDLMPPPPGLPPKMRRKPTIPEHSLDHLDYAGPPDVVEKMPEDPVPKVIEPVRVDVVEEDDDDEDYDPAQAGPLAAEGSTELPAAPSEKAEPKATDLDLDIFGAPMEETARES